MRRVRGKKKHYNLVVNAIANKLRGYMTVMSVTYEQSILSICFLFGSNVKAILNPLLTVMITRPSFSIAGIVPTVNSVQQYPSVQQILSFENDHWCNRTSVRTDA